MFLEIMDFRAKSIKHKQQKRQPRPKNANHKRQLQAPTTNKNRQPQTKTPITYKKRQHRTPTKQKDANHKQKHQPSAKERQPDYPPPPLTQTNIFV